MQMINISYFEFSCHGCVNDVALSIDKVFAEIGFPKIERK